MRPAVARHEPDWLEAVLRQGRRNFRHAFATSDQERDAFERWLRARAAGQRAAEVAERLGDGVDDGEREALEEELAERDDEAVARIMEAYDRAHGTRLRAAAGDGGLSVEFGTARRR